MDNYTKQAIEFLEKTNTTFSAKFLKNDYHFKKDESKRDVYLITFERGSRKFELEFGQSLVRSTKLSDPVTGNEFTMSGGCLKGNKRITGNIDKYKSAQGLIEIKGVPPTAYDVLSCLQKYDTDTFENFCSNYGCDTDSITALEIYKNCSKEYSDVCRIWSDEEIDELIEIS